MRSATVERNDPMRAAADATAPFAGADLIVPFNAQPADTMCHVETLQATSIAAWDAYVLARAEGTLFHSTAWRAAVALTFGHRSWYLLARRNGRVVGVLPMFLVASRLGGRMLVSVPYGVGGGILADEEEAAAALFRAAVTVAQQESCRLIDLRSEEAVVGGVPVIDRYVGFSRELPPCAEDVPGWLPRKARAAARNAQNKYRLTVDFDDRQLPEVWRLYTLSMRRLGSVSYPYEFFRRLVACTPDRHWVSLARRQGRAVAGLVAFRFKDRVMPYFFGAAREATACSAANLLYLSAMERGVAEGCRVFDFGRSRRDNLGSVNFKRFHGFQPRSLHYQRYVLGDEHPADLTPTAKRFRLARRVWPFLPLTVTQSLGARLAHHLPG